MPDRQPTLFIAILAAGRSSRFGSSKLTAELDGTPLLQRAASAAAEVCQDRVVTVIGHDRDAALAAAASNSGFVVVNEDYEKGLGSSIAVAARACRSTADALLIVLADQPFVTAEHLRALVDHWSGAADEIVASSYADTQGPPVLFPSGAFAQLASLSGDQGARELLHDQRYRLKTVRFEPAAVDIDTPGDLQATMDYN